MTPEEELKQLAIQRGAELVGIASVADINKYAPPDHRPDDILDGAKSVIVFAGHMALRGAWRSPNSQTHYYNRDFSRIHTGIASAMAKFIESNYGYYSLSEIPPTLGFNPSLSQKLCAELAGLGTRSMAAAIILHHNLGILSLATCITTMPLAADAPMAEPVCPHPSCVQSWERQKTVPCLETCPECLSGELEEGRIKWMRYDRRVCSTRAQTMAEGALQRTLLEGANEPDPEVRRSILLGSFSRSVTRTIGFGRTVGQCAECVRHCPICIRARSLTPKILNPKQG